MKFKGPTFEDTYLLRNVSLASWDEMNCSYWSVLKYVNSSIQENVNFDMWSLAEIYCFVLH